MDFTESIDLAAERLGGRVLAANDEFFAPKENLLKAAAPAWIADKYTDAGKWMDGWETRRRRTPGYDWCVVKLGLPGIIRGVVVDTSHFKGNYPESCELEACAADGDPGISQLEDPSTEWGTLLPKSNLAGDTRNTFPISSLARITHLRFKIYPDGGEIDFSASSLKSRPIGSDFSVDAEAGDAAVRVNLESHVSRATRCGNW